MLHIIWRKTKLTLGYTCLTFYIQQICARFHKLLFLNYLLDIYINNILKAAMRFCIKRFKTMKESRALTSSFAPPFRTNQGENTLKPNLVNSAGIVIKDRRS